jgi:hypothetical protein
MSCEKYLRAKQQQMRGRAHLAHLAPFSTSVFFALTTFYALAVLHAASLEYTAKIKCL